MDKTDILRQQMKTTLKLPEYSVEDLVRMRNEIGLSRKELSKFMKLSASVIGKIEDGYGVSESTIYYYQIVLERLWMNYNGYVPTYRKIGTNDYTYIFSK